jgi:hypothetical protein
MRRGQEVLGPTKEGWAMTHEEAQEKAQLALKWTTLDVGDTIVIHGVKCRLANVNTGKRRLTFVPVAGVKMPRGKSVVTRVVTKDNAKAPR